MNARIAEVRGLEILDSRGRPTVEATVTLGDGTSASASVPSGASTGSHEAVERRDGDPARYGGLGVRSAVATIEREIAEALHGLEPDQRVVDETLCGLDGTPDKARLGANAILAVSLATARVQATAARMPLWQYLAGDKTPVLPMPMVNIISGGLHASRQLDFQDFLVIPVGASSFSQALEMVSAVHNATGRLLAERGLSTLKADEGGYGPALADNQGALQLLDLAVAHAGLRPGPDIAYALDVAATHFFDPVTATYELQSESRSLTPMQLAEYLRELAEEHAVVSIEDPFSEDDWQPWADFTAALGNRLQIVGDDLFATNPERLARGIKRGNANAILIKMNQIGTLSETNDVIAQARHAGLHTVASARSGETEDPALADLAVGLRAGQIKIGSVTQSERLAKYNQLLRIEHALGRNARFAGWKLGA